MSILESILQPYIKVFSRRPLFMAVVMGIYAGVMVTFITIVDKEKDKVPDSKFREQVAQELIASIDPSKDIDQLSNQIKVIFSSYDRRSKGMLGEYGLVALLEDAYAINANNGEQKDKLEALLKLLDKQKEKDPYFGLKFDQEVIVKSLEKELSKLESSNYDASFIEQVKEVVRRQNSEIDELKKNNSLGIPVGIAGLVATVLFGLFSLLYPLMTRNKANKSIQATADASAD